MVWLKIHDRFEDHPKVARLSDAAHRLWIRAACWSQQREQYHAQGFIPRGMLRTIARNVASQKKLEELAQELVEATGEGLFESGLWETVDGGWRIHDWEQFQPREGYQESEETPKAKSEAGRLGGLKSAEARRRKYGTSQPKKVDGPDPDHGESTDNPRSTLEADSRSRLEASPKREPEADSKQTEAPASEANPKHAEAPVPVPVRSTPLQSPPEADEAGASGQGTVEDDEQAVSSARGPKPTKCPLAPGDFSSLEICDPGLSRDFAEAVVTDWLAEPPDPNLRLFAHQWKTTLLKIIRSTWRNERRRREIQEKLKARRDASPAHPPRYTPGAA